MKSRTTLKYRVDRTLWSLFVAILLLSILLVFVPGPVAQAQTSPLWYKTPSTAVLPKGIGATWDNGGVGTACVILDGTTYKMWYTGYDTTNGLLQIGYATSPDGKVWTRGNGGNPVLTPSGVNEAEGVGAPRVYKAGATDYRMWYTGYKDVSGELVPQIFYAISGDGITNWTRQNGGNPVVPVGGSGAFDEKGAHSAAVVYDTGTTYKMWYTGRSGTGLLGVSKIGYATSTDDGLTWVKGNGGNAVLSGDTATWDADGVAVPSVIKTDKYYMWYTGYSGLTKAAIQVKIGMAESTDGITGWTKLLTNPVIDEAASGFGVGGVGAPWVMEHGAGGAFEMWYSGLDTNMDSQVGYAVTGSITLTLTATLQGDSRPLAGYDVPLVFKVYDQAVTPGNITSLAPVAQFSTAAGKITITQTPTQAEIDAKTNKTITFEVAGVPAGNYYVTLYTPTCLVNLKNNVPIPLSGGYAFHMSTMREGDAVDITAAPPSLAINIDDFTVFATAYETHGVILPTYPTASINWNASADFDRDSWITIADFSLLYTNYGLTSPRTI